MPIMYIMLPVNVRSMMPIYDKYITTQNYQTCTGS